MVMKKIIIALVAVAVAAPVASFAADLGTVAGKTPVVDLGSCGAQSNTVQETIAKLQKELNKGTAVYSKDQLNKVKTELEEYELLQASLLQN
jgi:hypothetical protein